MRQIDPARWRADYPELIVRAVAASTRPNSPEHGQHHWQLVAWTGKELIDAGAQADPDVVFLFALFHDSMRFNEFRDPEHGKRGGELARELLSDWPYLNDERLETLVEACTDHTNGDTSEDPTIGVCWDSDRLNLWRVGYRPDPRFLSTHLARSPERIEWARELQSQEFSWSEICLAYQGLD